MLKRPVFTHPCDECIFLGRFLKHDLYIHPETDIFARFGDDEDQQISGYSGALNYGNFESNAEKDRILFEALKRSISIGVFPKKVIQTEIVTTPLLEKVEILMKSLEQLSHSKVSSTNHGYLVAAVRILSLIKD